MESRRQSIFSAGRAESMARKRDSYDEEHQKQEAQLEKTRLEKVKASRERRSSLVSTAPRSNRRAGRPPPVPSKKPAVPLSPKIGDVLSPRKRGERNSKTEAPSGSSNRRSSSTPVPEDGRSSLRRSSLTPVTVPDNDTYKKMSEYRADLPRRLTNDSPPKNPRLGSKPAPPVEMKRNKRKRIEAALKIKDRETEIVAVAASRKRSSAVKKEKPKRKVAKKKEGTSPRKAAKWVKSKPVVYGLKKKKKERPKPQVEEKTSEGEEEEEIPSKQEEEEGQDEEEEEGEDEEDEEKIERKEEVDMEVEKEEEAVKDVVMEAEEEEELDCEHSDWESITADDINSEDLAFLREHGWVKPKK